MGSTDPAFNDPEAEGFSEMTDQRAKKFIARRPRGPFNDVTELPIGNIVFVMARQAR